MSPYTLPFWVFITHIGSCGEWTQRACFSLGNPLVKHRFGAWIRKLRVPQRLVARILDLVREPFLLLGSQPRTTVNDGLKAIYQHIPTPRHVHCKRVRRYVVQRSVL